MTGVYYSNQLPERLAIALEDWCALHARPSWAGGSGTLRAAEVLVNYAVNAGNIPMTEVEMPKFRTVKERCFVEYLKRQNGNRP